MIMYQLMSSQTDCNETSDNKIIPTTQRKQCKVMRGLLKKKCYIRKLKTAMNKFS